ncbi:MAG: molybdate ABC transporter substrate-binding protein [Planctomycetaceae bacterium]
MRRAALFVVAALIVTSCSSGSGASAGAGSTTLTVFAASSLTGAFDRIGKDFEAANPGTNVVFDYGSSTDLAAQIQSEGTADVFASASGTAMDTVASEPGVTGRADFAANRLVVVTPQDDPASISSLQDLARPGVQVVLGAEGVPVGDYAREALRNAGLEQAVLANVVSNEQDDASIVTKIAGGEADAAIVYTSDVSGPAGAGLRSVPIPDAFNVVATYPIAIVTGSAHATDARAFVAYVTGDAGQATLERFGFGPAPG